MAAFVLCGAHICESWKVALGKEHVGMSKQLLFPEPSPREGVVFRPQELWVVPGG